MKTGTPTIPKVEWRGRLTPNDGHWWALVDFDNGVSTWAPIGKISDLEPKSIMGCYRLARWYYMAGILETITGPIIRENGTEVLEIIKGKATRV